MMCFFFFANNSYLQFVKIYSEVKEFNAKCHLCAENWKYFLEDVVSIPHDRKMEIYDAIVNDIKLWHTTEEWEKLTLRWTQKCFWRWSYTDYVVWRMMWKVVKYQCEFFVFVILHIFGLPSVYFFTANHLHLLCI